MSRTTGEALREKLARIQMEVLTQELDPLGESHPDSEDFDNARRIAAAIVKELEAVLGEPYQYQSQGDYYGLGFVDGYKLASKRVLSVMRDCAEVEP